MKDEERKVKRTKKKKPLLRLFLFGVPGEIRPPCCRMDGTHTSAKNAPPEPFSSALRAPSFSNLPSVIIRQHRRTSRSGRFFYGVPGEIRTPGLPLRRRTLYPAELRKLIYLVLNMSFRQSGHTLL